MSFQNFKVFHIPILSKLSDNKIILQQRDLSDSSNMRQLFVTKDFLTNPKEEETRHYIIHQANNYIRIWKKIKFASLILISLEFWTQLIQKN